MNKEREEYILKKILAEKKVSVKELAREMYASEPSVRRDLASLEKQGLLRRVHGGAIIEEDSFSHIRIPFILRESEQSDEKALCAKKAAQLVEDGDVIFLDSSSSAYNIVPFLVAKNRITVITNGVKVIEKAGEYNIKTIGTGGDYMAVSCAFVGDRANKCINEYNADKVFFSTRGITLDGRATDFSTEEDEVRQSMIKRSKKVYYICTGDKAGKEFFHNVCTVEEIDGIISAKKLGGVLEEKQI